MPSHMLRPTRLRIAVALALLAIPPAAFAQAAPPAMPAPPARPAPPAPPAPPMHGGNPGNPGYPNHPYPRPSGGNNNHGNNGHGNNGNYAPGVYVDASNYIATPNPHKTPFHNTSHNTIPPGQEVFSSQSTGK